MEKRLIRKRENALVGGICSGIASYLSIDPLWVRLFFVIWIIAGGASIFVYIILWVVIPLEGDTAPLDLNTRLKIVGNELSEIFRQPNAQLITYAGVALIGMGILALARYFGFFWLNWVHWDLFWPVLMMIAGAFLLIRALTHRN